MTPFEDGPLLNNRLDVHDRKQFEIKLEYQPDSDGEAKYLIETFFFLPSSLNVDAETYPRHDFYADIHNYVRLKTPVLTFVEILEGELSPLRRFEQLAGQRHALQTDLVYQAKLLSCVFRGGMRRFCGFIDGYCATHDAGQPLPLEEIEERVKSAIEGSTRVLTRFREAKARLGRGLEEKTLASLRLVDEYMSLSLEQFFRKAVAEMDRLPRTPLFLTLRKDLLNEVIRDEGYRREHGQRSVLSPTGDNEEYMHRIGFLKKFCMNILFLRVRRDAVRKTWEEVILACAAGVAMIFSTGAAWVGMQRFPQASVNFFLLLVISYMFKDRIKEGCRRIFTAAASKHLYDRATVISDPVTQVQIGKLHEKVDYNGSFQVPAELLALRCVDDFATVSQGELSETVIRYQKLIHLDDKLFERNALLSRGVTDIIRFNIDRLLRDMDDPEYAIEYVDSDALTVGRVRGAKAYQVDVAFRFTVSEASRTKRVTYELVRLVLDRNGIKRMVRLGPESASPFSSSAEAA